MSKRPGPIARWKNPNESVFVMPSMLRITALSAAVAVFCLVEIGAQSRGSSLVLVGGTIYIDPQSRPITDSVVVVKNGTITQVGRRTSIQIPSGVTTINCGGLFVTAGFQNSHVHFTEDKWADALTQPVNKLTTELQTMLTRYGITTVVDTGSLRSNTVALRRRIESGEVAGPRILT